MKRIICMVCLTALLLAGCSTQQAELAMPIISTIPAIPEGDYIYGIYQLTFKTKRISHDCVGNDWSFTYTYEGKTIESGYKIPYSLELFTFLPVEVEVREKDKIDDVGTGRLRVAIFDGGSGKTEITVTENAGAFKGNTAVWEVSCDIEMVGLQ